MNKMQLRQLGSWMGFMGLITIITGILLALSGLFAFIIGAIPGIITIILGVKLRAAKRSCELMAMDTHDQYFSSNFNMLTANLSAYFKIQGILVILTVIMVAVGTALAVALGATVPLLFIFQDIF